MEGIKFSKKPKLKKPYLITGWPGMGEVAFKAVSCLVDKLKAEEFAAIPSQDFFYLTGSVVHDGMLEIPQMPQGKFYYWKNKAQANDLIIFLSNAQPDLAKAEEYCRRIISLAKGFQAKLVISLAAMPQAIDHTSGSKVWFAPTSKKASAIFKPYNLEPLLEGQISGMNGLFLGLAKQAGFEGACLLAEIPLYTIQIENPKASCAALEVVSKILNIRLDLNNLLEEAQSMENEINRLLDYLKVGTTPGPIGEEDIEKIKKSLTQLTKLPFSIKENIEKLFSQAVGDISRANELKSELDKWNVYKEYEDRFLDLFKKKKDKDN